MNDEFNDDINNLIAAFKAIQLPEFMGEGACVGEDPVLFDDEDEGLTFKAKRICQGCPVRIECAQWGIANEPAGVWGGLSTKELEKARKGRGKFVPLERRREDLEWLEDLQSNKSAKELAIKYGKSERTIYRWRNGLDGDVA